MDRPLCSGGKPRERHRSILRILVAKNIDQAEFPVALLLCICRAEESLCRMFRQKLRACEAFGKLGVIAIGPEAFCDLIERVIVVGINQRIAVAAAANARPPAPRFHIQCGHIGMEHFSKLKGSIHIVGVVIARHTPFAHVQRQISGLCLFIDLFLDRICAAVIMSGKMIHMRCNFFARHQFLKARIRSFPVGEIRNAQLHFRVSGFQLIDAGFVDGNNFRNCINTVFLRGVAGPG